MQSKSLMHASASDQRTVTDVTDAPPRTWGGLLLYAVLPVVTLAGLIALEYPVVVTAGLVGVVIGVLATRMAQRLPRRRRQSTKESVDRVRTAS
ncbi:MAG: hypothetical protein SVG88_03305 [Halobacteriales archaeon]|nr:hypothetical protein [Halobacteriales archaeon]